MTELSDRLKRDINDGMSIRGIGRKAGMSNSTVRRALAGQEIDHSTIEKFARYLKTTTDEVYRMAGLTSESSTLDDDPINRKIAQLLRRLTDDERIELLLEIDRIVARRAPPAP